MGPLLPRGTTATGGRRPAAARMPRIEVPVFHCRLSAASTAMPRARSCGAAPSITESPIANTPPRVTGAAPATTVGVGAGGAVVVGGTVVDGVLRMDDAVVAGEPVVGAADVTRLSAPGREPREADPLEHPATVSPTSATSATGAISTESERGRAAMRVGMGRQRPIARAGPEDGQGSGPTAAPGLSAS